MTDTGSVMQLRSLSVHWLGRIGYDAALALQDRLVELRRGRAAADTLLLLEHDPVVTMGRGGRPEHVLHTREELDRRGVQLRDSGRGGDATYHGPGQLVGYPILDLGPDRRDVRRYVTDLEEVMIRLAMLYGLRARRIDGLRGVWVDDRKLGAVGVRISRWVTKHGFALNAETDLENFGLIVPCGISNCQVTSVARETGRPIDLERLAKQTGRVFAEVFACEPRWHDGPPTALPEAPDP